jgi:hypothetical protein
VRTMDLDGCDTGSNEDERARMAAQLPIQHTAVRCGAEGARWLNIACYARQRAVAAALAAPPSPAGPDSAEDGTGSKRRMSNLQRVDRDKARGGQDLGEVR